MPAGIVRIATLISVSALVACQDPLAPTVQTLSPAASGPRVNAPSNTNAVAVSHSQIDVSWQDNSGNEIGFEVYVSTTGASGTFAQQASTGADVTDYNHGGLSHLSEYCYQVRAVRRTGSKVSYSGFSPIACATTPAPPVPANPSGTNAWPGGSTGVWVSWLDNSNNETGFRVERSLDAGSTWTTAATVGPDQYYIFDGGLAIEQQVCYRIIASNAGGDSPASNTDCTTPPAAPTNLTATFIESTGDVEIAWLDNSGVEDGYQLWLYDYDGYLYTVSLPPDVTSYRASIYDYVYGIVALKDEGNSDWAFPAEAASATLQNRTATVRRPPSMELIVRQRQMLLAGDRSEPK